MKRYLLLMAALMAFFIILFFIVEAFKVPLLSDPTPWMKHGGVLAASLGVGLLIADVLLPVPSSLVMVAHGALFGVVVGTLLSRAWLERGRGPVRFCDRRRGVINFWRGCFSRKKGRAPIICWGAGVRSAHCRYASRSSAGRDSGDHGGRFADELEPGRARIVGGFTASRLALCVNRSGSC